MFQCDQVTEADAGDRGILVEHHIAGRQAEYIERAVQQAGRADIQYRIVAGQEPGHRISLRIRSVTFGSPFVDRTRAVLLKGEKIVLIAGGYQRIGKIDLPVIVQVDTGSVVFPGCLSDQGNGGIGRSSGRTVLFAAHGDAQ